jgi:hypothetical protein
MKHLNTFVSKKQNFIKLKPAVHILYFLDSTKHFSDVLKILKSDCVLHLMASKNGRAYSGLKQQGREADHSPPSSGEVKNGGAIPPLPHTFSWRTI